MPCGSKCSCFDCVVARIADDATSAHALGSRDKNSAAGGVLDDIGDFLKDVADDADAIGNFLGMTGINFNSYFFRIAIGHGESPSSLYDALKKDLANADKSGDIAKAIESGDYAKTWNIVTDNGHKLYPDLPHPLFKRTHTEQGQPYDARARLDAALAGGAGVDARAISQELYDSGYPELAAQVDASLNVERRYSPLGAFMLRGAGGISDSALYVFDLARELRTAAAMPFVEQVWPGHSATLRKYADELDARARSMLAAMHKPGGVSTSASHAAASIVASAILGDAGASSYITGVAAAARSGDPQAIKLVGALLAGKNALKKSRAWWSEYYARVALEHEKKSGRPVSVGRARRFGAAERLLKGGT